MVTLLGQRAAAQTGLSNNGLLKPMNSYNSLTKKGLFHQTVIFNGQNVLNPARASFKYEWIVAERKELKD